MCYTIGMTEKRRGPGRPKREGGPKVHKSVRLDQIDVDTAEYFAMRDGIDISEYLRRAVIAQNEANARRASSE